MLRRFISYYKPHIGLFILDIGVAFLTAIISVTIPILTRNIIKKYIPSGDMNSIILMISIWVGVIVLKSIFSYIRLRWGHILGVKMEYDMRSELFRHLQKLSFSYFDNTKTGHIMSRISNDLNTIAEVAHHGPEDFIISIFIIIGAFIAMFTYNFHLAVVSLIPLPLILIWGITYGRKMKSGFRSVRQKIAEINSSVENSVQGIREVKSYANEHLEIKKFGSVNDRFRISKEVMYKLMAIFHGGMQFLTDFYYLTVISGGVILITKNKIDVTELLIFTLYINYILDPIKRLVNFTEQFQQGSTAFERFTEILDIDPEIKDSKNAISKDNIEGNIEIKNISFKYDSTPDYVIKNVSISVGKGKSIALVGESGAGKSTLVSLIPRFYEVEKGEILIDDHNILDVKQRSLRENIGIVQQNVFLFDSTIRENILYGNPNATEEEMIEAARNANILDFIQSLPDGFDTLTGERGVKLSGGQKQRVSIARVFLKNPPILIFDEATSALDSESESLIQDAMEELSKGRTTIVIAHRLSTVKNVDYLYVMKDGEVVEKGNHQELIDLDGYYKSLYTKNQI
jgi:ATP-binding cassette subfamily B protein